jgi:hypothetical protein
MICHQNLEELILLHAISHHGVDDHQPQSRLLTNQLQLRKKFLFSVMSSYISVGMPPSLLKCSVSFADDVHSMCPVLECESEY